MEKKELEKYKLELTQQRKREIDAVNEKFDRRLKAVEVLLEDATDSAKTNGHAGVSGQRLEPKSLIAATRAAIQATDQNFSSPQLFAYIKTHFPSIGVKTPAEVSAPLWVLKRDNEIEVITQGIGRSPSVYKRTSNFKALV